MKTTSLILSLTTAAVTAAQFNETSAPFHLIVESADNTVNTTISACHTGAALESLCLSSGNTTSNPNPIAPATFYFNTSASIQPPSPSLGEPGILTWFLPTSTGNYPSSVYFYYDPTTDIAQPILETGANNPQIMAFDKNDELVLQGYIDWSQNPPNGQGNWREFYRWFACVTYYAGYQYDNLVWGLGPGMPEDPTCRAVNVTRVFL